MGYSRAFDRVPGLRALCSTQDGVAQALKWARDTETGFAVRSGGHSFAGLSQHEDLVIDLRRMDDVRLDAAQGTVTVGAGATLGKVARTLARRNLSVPGGICAPVGMAGHTLGGGIGYFGRRDGLLSDQLESLRIVTANGELLNVSEDSHPDLFWACRGGGTGNFGIVTDLTLRVQRAQPMQWVRFTAPVGAIRAAETLFLWQHRAQTWPRHTVLHLRLAKQTGASFLITLEGLSGWSGEDLATELAILLRTTSDEVRRAIYSGTMSELIQRMMPSDAFIRADLLSHSHLYRGPMGERATLDVLSALLDHPAGRVNLNIEPLGGAVADKAPSATAFPHREASFAIQSQVILRESDDREALTASNEAMRSVLEAQATGGVYANYPDLSLSDWGRKYWGNNLPRLKEIKARHDPEAVFDHAHSIARA